MFRIIKQLPSIAKIVLPNVSKLSVTPTPSVSNFHVAQHPVRFFGSSHSSSFVDASSIPSPVFVGYKEKKTFTVNRSTSLDVRFSYGRGMFELKITNGRIKLGNGTDITNWLPDKIQQAKSLKLVINNGVKVNDYDISNLIVGGCRPDIIRPKY